MRSGFKSALLQSVAGVVIALSYAGTAAAQDAPAAAETATEDAEGSKTPTQAEKVVVYGTAYRNRNNETAPVLNYGLDYFQKFEPLTVGDALKRVPSVTFQSDVLEYDGVRLRGLDPGYTQILINGEKVPGSDVDRSFWVDRIPAELIERVEIVRSSSADRSGDALAGAINIILRDAYSLDGGYLKLGGLRFNDDEIKPVAGGVFGAPVGEGRVLLGGNMQGRHNPKEKVSFRYSNSLAFDNREDQSDVRDGTDYSVNGSFIHPIWGGQLDLSGAFVRTDRTETEHSLEYEHPTSTLVTDLTETSDQFEDIIQDNYSLRAKVDVPFLGGEAKVKVGFASFKDDVTETEIANEYEGGVIVDTDTDVGLIDQTDEEFSATLAQVFEYEAFSLKFGVDYVSKSRDDVINEIEIEEERIDPYALVRGEQDAFSWEAGVRYETTDASFTQEGLGASTDYDFFLPSAHVLFNVTDDDRLRASVARTVRRPNFDQLSPAVEEEAPTEDHDLAGNPALKPESAWGFDVSYERRLGKRGVAGVNFFYRDVQDRIEIDSTGVVSSSGDGFVLAPFNIGDGKVWGVEFDLSTPLTFVGLDNTGVFLNYSWLDSEITDPLTQQKRRFNDQAKYVFNVGFIQDLPEWAAAFGASYRKQGEQFNNVRSESVTTKYGADLEVFIEKRFGENFVLRFTGSNLLDAKKEEKFLKWETELDQEAGLAGIDELEFESEKAGPVFQLVGRYAF